MRPRNAKTVNAPDPPSVFFFTLHECVSTLFRIYVLNHVDGLTYVNIAKAFANDMSPGEITLYPTGDVCGAIRVGPR